MNTKKIILALGIVVAVIAILGGYYFPITQSKVGAVTSSPAGSSNSNQQYIAVAITPLTTTSTSTSVLNPTGGTDRFITGIFTECTGAGASAGATGAGLTSAGWILHIATSTQANAGLDNNVQYVFNGSISTTTLFSYNASTTGTIQTSSAPSTLATFSNIWSVGSYLNFSFNATNTAACTVSAEYIPL